MSQNKTTPEARERPPEGEGPRLWPHAAHPDPRPTHQAHLLQGQTQAPGHTTVTKADPQTIVTFSTLACDVSHFRNLTLTCYRNINLIFQ